MKARVKGTTEIIEVEFDSDALNNCYPPYRDRENNMFYQPEQLEWIDIEEKADPDYWTRLEHQYAGMAMQGIMTYIEQITPKKGRSYCDEIVDISLKVAHALVEKLKESKIC